MNFNDVSGSGWPYVKGIPASFIYLFIVQNHLLYFFTFSNMVSFLIWTLLKMTLTVNTNAN